MIYRTVRRLFILLIGGTVALIGIIMLVTPGPALLVIPAGLAILATEFAWAAWLLKRLKRQAADVVNTLRSAGSSHTTAAGEHHQTKSEPVSSPLRG